jgi:integrase
VRWGHMTVNPAKLAGRNPQPPPRPIRVYTLDDLEAIAAELAPMYQRLPAFAAATGLRPEEWAVLKRGDVDRRGATLRIRRTISAGEIVELAKTSRSRREVPLSDRALAALDELPRRLDSLYMLRSTFASNSLAAGVTVFELARLMGTSVAMIERHYGTLLEGAGADIARRLSAFEAKQGRARDRATDADP